MGTMAVHSPQAKLLRTRQDVKAYQVHFDVDLPHTVLCKARQDVPARLGLAVQPADAHPGLTVVKVDDVVGFDTAIANHNWKQRHLRQPWFLVEAGDQITMVNDCKTSDAMIWQFKKKTDPLCTSELSLKIHKELDDTMQADGADAQD